MYTSERVDSRDKTLDEKIERIRPRTEPKIIGKGEYLFQQGDDASGVYYIASGLFFLSAYHEKKEDHIVRPLGFALPNQFLGLVETLDDSPTYRQYARAEALSKVYFFPRIDDVNVLDLLRSLEMDRLRLYGLPIFETPEMKIGWYLSGLINGSKGNKDSYVELHKNGSATLYKSNKDIAMAIGMSGESVARTFSLARKKGVEMEYKNGVGVRSIGNLKEFFTVFG